MMMMGMMRAFLVFSAVGAVCSVPIVDDVTPRQGEKCQYESCPETKADILNVHIVPHTHDDVGWLKTVDQYYYGSKNTIQKAGVQYILDSVIKELWADPKRKFIYVETAFFWKWWVRQSDDTRHKVHALVRQGRLQFVGGAWSMNDEAATHYQSTIDQFTWGLSKLNETFGYCGLPRVGWQIDPFGHAREFASLLAAMGYDGLFLGRIDYQDKNNRLKMKNMETLWRGDDDLGKASDIFTGVLYNTYSPPRGFCFDVLCDDEPIIDDPDSPMFNVDQRISTFLEICNNMSNAYKTNNVLVTMGEDFNYQDATMWFHNLDKLIEYTNMKAAKDGLNVKLFYSTPNCYLKAVKDANPTLPTKQDDYFPYASDPTAYWTGYFTSRPTTKYFEREGNNYLQAIKQMQVLTGLEEHNEFVINELKSAMGVMQHHDAVTGTEKEHVTHDYERLLDQAIEDSLIVAKQALNKQLQADPTQPPLLSFDRCHFNESRCHVSENSEQFVVTVYNPLAWTLEATPVKLPVEAGEYSVVACNGEEIVSQLVELPFEVTKIPTRESSATHEVVFLAYNVPGMGYKSFYVTKKSKKIKRDTGKRKSEAYEHVNDYWKNIREKTVVDIKYVEEQANEHRDNIVRVVQPEIKIPDQPNYYNGYDQLDLTRSKHSYTNLDDTNKDNEKNIDMLKDNKYDENNRNVEELEKLIEEARTQLYKKNKSTFERNVKYPNLNDEEMRMLADAPAVIEQSSDDTFLENMHFKLRIDNTSGQVTHIVLPDGTETPFTVQMLYYPGCVGDNTNKNKRSSGAYIFRPNATKPFNLYRNDSTIIKGEIVEELQYTLADYASGVLRLYKHPKLNYIENEWLVGPIPINDNVGKEVIVKYLTDIINNGEFYTDSNGRQMLKRKLNQRPQWNVTLEEPIAGNYYPITNKIYIEDSKRFAVLTDRSQGGTSLEEGAIEIMLHRRLLHDDAFGVGEALNETAKGVGLVVRGKHKIVISQTLNKDTNVDEKKKVLETHLQPIIFVSDAKNLNLTDWLTLKNKVGAIKTVPSGIHMLTVEPWNENKLLLRLENYLEKSDNINSTIQIDLTNVFENIRIKTIKETTLAANQWLSNYNKWTWNKEEEFSESFNEAYGSFSDEHNPRDDQVENSDEGFKIILKAKEIKTFVVDYELVNNL